MRLLTPLEGTGQACKSELDRTKISIRRCCGCVPCCVPCCEPPYIWKVYVQVHSVMILVFPTDIEIYATLPAQNDTYVTLLRRVATLLTEDEGHRNEGGPCSLS